jgi:hypothetical protein
MNKIRKHFDPGSLVVIVVTFILFLFALFTKGFTHDFLLEAAVFLVSVKLIVMMHKNKGATDSLYEILNEIHKKVDAIEPRHS